MEVARGWMCVSRTITTAWRVRRHAPCVNRLFQLREVSDHSKYLEKSTKIEALLAESHNLLDGIQTLEFLRDLLGKVGKKQHVSLLLSDNANFREIFNGMCENAATYDTDTLVELIELLHEYGVTSNDVLLQLVEELGSRMSGMSYHCQQQVLHLLTKLKVNHVSLLHGYRDTVSFTRSLNQNAMNKDTVGRAVVFLRNQYWSNELGKSLQDYVLANASELDLWSVSQILSVMIGKQLATRDIFMVCARTVTNILTRDIPVSDRCEVWGNFYPGVLNGLLRAFGKCKFCDEDLYHAFASLVEGAPDPYLQTSKFISNMSWSCGKVRFYSESLMDSIADHSLRGFPTFSNQDIAVLLYGFGALNCSHLDLFHTMVERVVGDEDHLTNHILCWTIVWVGMVLEQYPGNLLSRMLTDDFLTYSSDLSFDFTALLQLSVALNFEHPEVGLGVSSDPDDFSNWGKCMPPVGDVSDDMMKLALKHRLSQYKQTSRYSPFSQNVARALKVALGGTYFYNTEALSLSGYNLDFEILFDDQHRPIAIPFQWKYRKYDILLNSIGFGGRRGKRKLTTEVLESLKEAERNAHTATLPSSRIHEFNIDPRQTPVHLASDWGLKFSVPDAPVAKKVAVEVDGPVHFASNCNHVMGSTILKQRQLKALGWEVVSIPFKEWEHLPNGDDHVQYLIEKLNLCHLRRY